MAKEGKDMEKKLSSKSCSAAPEAKGKEYNGKSNNNRNQRFHGKRRDPWPAEGNVQSRNQPPKPRNKAFGKKNGAKHNWSGRRDEVTKAQRAEFGSALPHGSKKINLNHLLNFKLEPRGHQNGSKVGHRGQWSNKWGGYRHTKYNKEQFLQANCQFVVKSSEDYTVNMHDPDSIIDWDLVEQVRLLGHEVPCCPICLYPPSAAQITRCGHIFCWSCILHYLALSDKHWRKCPICYESVIKKDLKSVVATEQPLYKPGDEITMCLMKRQRGSVVSQPVYMGENIEEVTSPYNILEKRTKSCFVKLLIASPEEVKYLVLSSEKAGLEKQMQDNDDELEKTFIQAAMDSLKEREEALTGGMPSLLAKEEEPVLPAPPPDSHVTEEEEEEATISATPDDTDYFVYASAFSDEEAEAKEEEDEDGEHEPAELPVAAGGGPVDEAPQHTESSDHPAGVTTDGVPPSPPLLPYSNPRQPTTSESTESSLDSPLSPSPRKVRPSQKTHTYYFYQSDDGQPIFIHPLNVRCLVQQYGSLDKCPLTITARIVEMEHSSMTEDIRHRLRYMVHLPLTCNFAICELDLKPPVVSEETLQLFQDDFLRRKKVRDRKLKEEKRRERRLQTEMNKSYGIYPGSQYSLQSSRHFPTCGSISDDQLTVSEGSSSPGQATPLSTSAEDSQGFPKQIAGSTAAAVKGPPSFAQMLREGQARPGPPRKMSGHRGPDQQGTEPALKVVDSDESDNEDRVPVPQYQDAFSDAIQDALDKVSLNKTNGQVTAAATTGRKGKKGRKKQQLLFSTAGPRFK